MTKKFLVLFTALVFFLSLFHLDTWQNGSTTSRAIAVVAFSETRTLQVDKFHERSVDKIFVDGHYYSDKAPLSIFLTIPFFEMADLFGIEPQNKERVAYLLGDIVCGSIPFTLIVLITFLFVRKNIATKFSPVLLTLFPFFGSFIFIYSGTFYGHMLSALFLLVSYTFLRSGRKFLLAGFLCGLSALTEFPTALVGALWAVQILINEKSFRPAILFCTGILPSVLLLFIYNYSITGNFLSLSYDYHADKNHHSLYGFSFPSAEALWGLVLGLKRGLLLYAPFVILFLFELAKRFSSKKFPEVLKGLFTNYLSLISVVSILVISSFFEWTGGWCYGPRLIFFIAVLLTFEGILFFSSQRFFKPLFGLLIGFGLICTFMAKSTVVYSVPTEIQNPITEQVLPNFMSGNFNPNNLLTMIFNVPPQTANYIFFGLFAAAILLLTVLYNREKQTADAK